ncbi:hypothetical protein E1B28_011290 [Marasmius oreades]|uniref:Uncharacterized protein n=1 Tax=Marasmius oreades TaxID=181124 RepID=A0A9P7RTU0_9AGAR|nr:uncharacterized protein E1B28_011290 [Marasmius oreades]KAG7089624.1 hypothetical protein E1B28_011290 [Marasmius oreades]
MMGIGVAANVAAPVRAVLKAVPEAGSHRLRSVLNRVRNPRAIAHAAPQPLTSPVPSLVPPVTPSYLDCRTFLTVPPDSEMFPLHKTSQKIMQRLKISKTDMPLVHHMSVIITGRI